MQHKHLKIGPGGLMYVIIAALILAVAIYTQANLLFWGFGLMVGGLTVSVTLTVVMMHQLSLQRVLPSHGVAGEPIVLRYTIVNHKRWIPVFGLLIGESWGRSLRSYTKTGPISEHPGRLLGRPFGWVLHLGARQTVQAEAPCWPMRRGFLDFEKVAVSTSFPFGVIRRIVVFELPGQVLVYPHLWRINRQMLHNLSNVDPYRRSRVERPGGHEDFFGLRQYRAGDSLKMIDWKRSARTGNLITREMTRPCPPRIMIALDLSDCKPLPTQNNPATKKPPKPDAGSIEAVLSLLTPLERAVSLTASLVCDAHFHGFQIGLVVVGVQCAVYPIQHSLGHRTKMLESLSLLDESLHSDQAPHTPSPTTIYVRIKDDGLSLYHGTTLLAAQDLEQYVSQLQGGSVQILQRRRPPQARRHHLLTAGTDTWT